MYSKTYQFFYSFREKAAKQFSALFSFRLTYIYLGLAVIMQGLAWLASFYIKSHLGGELLILHNNPYFGIDWIASGSQIFMLPLWALGVLLFNLIVLLFLSRHKQARFFVNFLLGLALAASIFSLVNLFFIYLINFH